VEQIQVLDEVFHSCNHVAILQPFLLPPQTAKQIGIQQLFSQRTIVSFYKSMLHWFSGLDKLRLDLLVFTPTLQFIADKFRTVTHSDGSWSMDFMCDSIVVKDSKMSLGLKMSPKLHLTNAPCCIFLRKLKFPRA
jgi:hypothetical protein